MAKLDKALTLNTFLKIELNLIQAHRWITDFKYNSYWWVVKQLYILQIVKDLKKLLTVVQFITDISNWHHSLKNSRALVAESRSFYFQYKKLKRIARHKLSRGHNTCTRNKGTEVITKLCTKKISLKNSTYEKLQ